MVATMSGDNMVMREREDPHGIHDAMTSPPVRVHTRAVADESARTFTGSLLLGCDGANSTVRGLLGIRMRDLRFTERWLVVDVRAAAPLDATSAAINASRPRVCLEVIDGELTSSVLLVRRCR